VIGNARKLPANAVVESDICIVGGGAAGITIAHELERSTRRVVVLAGGDRRERPDDRDLYRGEIAPGTSHEPLEEGRRRKWGGTTSAWHGRCVPFDPIDLEHRSWIPDSGWPIQYDELEPYLARATELCEAGPFQYDARETFPGAQAEMVPGFDGPDMVTSRLARFSPPTNFARRYGPALEKARGINVLLGAHAVSLDLDVSRARITRLHARTSRGTELTVVADRYVLACGGLENARLLLASRHQRATGIGNERDNVGRYYMSHLFGALGWIELRSPGNGFMYEYERDPQGVYCRRRFWITPRAQSEHLVGNAIAELERPALDDPSHNSALLSAMSLAKAYGSAVRERRVAQSPERWRSARPTRGSHWRTVVRGAPSLLRDAPLIARARYFQRRRLPGILGPQSVNHFTVEYHTEHLPHRSSRVVLTEDRDAFGVPRLEVRVAFDDQDVRTVTTFHRLLAAQLSATRTGEFHPYDDDLEQQVELHLANFHSRYHHLGTTRMSATPADGVVDRDCRVHEVHNLYIAGGSVFPTSSHANPTLTLVALAARLADHLRRLPDH